MSPTGRYFDAREVSIGRTHLSFRIYKADTGLYSTKLIDKREFLRYLFILTVKSL